MKLKWNDVLPKILTLIILIVTLHLITQWSRMVVTDEIIQRISQSASRAADGHEDHTILQYVEVPAPVPAPPPAPTPAPPAATTSTTQTTGKPAREHNQQIDKRWEGPEMGAPCGEICSYSGKVVKAVGETRGTFDQLSKAINCDNIMARMAHKSDEVLDPPPREPPPELKDLFTMAGQATLREEYHNQVGYSPAEHSAQVMQGLIQTVLAGEHVSMYKENNCVQDTIKRFADRVKGQHGVVIGTVKPWVEAILLANGVRQVTTLEYNPLKINHTQIDIFTPYDYAKKFLARAVPQVDFAVTFSSLEHSGLGRYGDPLNPYGDLEAMAQIWCMLKPGATFFVGIPHRDQDFVDWNAERIYGPARLPHMAANWEVEEMVNGCGIHIILVLNKPH